MVSHVIADREWTEPMKTDKHETSFLINHVEIHTAN